jgi:cobalt-zinc-cadmium efflux system outer membrane protein
MLLSIAKRVRPWQLTTLVCLFLSVRGVAAAPADDGQIDVTGAIRLALAQSPTVRAGRHRLEAAEASLRRARSAARPTVELAPGVGFTNGNALLAQEIDIAGRRGAASRVAAGDREAAAAEFSLARLQAAADAQLSYFDLVRAEGGVDAAEEAATLARRIAESVRRQVEAGLAPPIQATRAEIEVARAEGELLRAAGDRRARAAALNLRFGRSPEAAVVPVDALPLPAAPASGRELTERALAQRPDLQIARARLEARRGSVEAARAQGRPFLAAEVPADIWSLDRDPFQSEDLGFQVRLSMPLFAGSVRRAEVDRARASVREGEAELETETRAAAIEIARAAAELEAARSVALTYQERILPRSQELLSASERGFEQGLSSYLEVLEAQRVARQTRSEGLVALFEAVRARIALDRALGTLPPGAEE